MQKEDNKEKQEVFKKQHPYVCDGRENTEEQNNCKECLKKQPFNETVLKHQRIHEKNNKKTEIKKDDNMELLASTAAHYAKTMRVRDTLILQLRTENDLLRSKVEFLEDELFQYEKDVGMAIMSKMITKPNRLDDQSLINEFSTWFSCPTETYYNDVKDKINQSRLNHRERMLKGFKK